MQQVVDLEGSQEFQALKVAIVSVATDPIPDLARAAQEFKVKSSLLSDAEGHVVKSYGVHQWAMPSGEPGHTFVLVGKDGKVKWIRDYGAPANGGLMYIQVGELYQEITTHISAP